MCPELKELDFVQFSTYRDRDRVRDRIILFFDIILNRKSVLRYFSSIRPRTTHQVNLNKQSMASTQKGRVLFTYTVGSRLPA